MSFRIPIGQAAALFEDGAADFAPAPAERTVRFADTPVEFVPGEDQIRISTDAEDRPRPVSGRIYH
jgi:hypothetical protein